MDAVPRSRPVPTARPSRDSSDPAFKHVELAQRARMILDVAEADLEIAEARLGPFHETTWHFRNTLAEARRSWDRLRAEFGRAALEAALSEPPVAILTLRVPGDPLPEVILVPIAGKTYRVESLTGTSLAPVQYRLTRLPDHDDGPYYLCRLADGGTQCDCAEWVYHVADRPEAPPCKHIAALAAMGWL